MLTNVNHGGPARVVDCQLCARPDVEIPEVIAPGDQNGLATITNRQLVVVARSHGNALVRRGDHPLAHHIEAGAPNEMTGDDVPMLEDAVVDHVRLRWRRYDGARRDRAAV